MRHQLRQGPVPVAAEARQGSGRVERVEAQLLDFRLLVEEGLQGVFKHSAVQARRVLGVPQDNIGGGSTVAAHAGAVLVVKERAVLL